MMKKLLIMLMMVMMFAATAYADNGKQSEAEIVKAKFNVMATDIIKEIETKYAAGNIAVLHNELGWRQYKLDELTYQIDFADTGLEHKRYIGTIYVSFWVFGLWDHDRTAYRETKEEAANIRPSKLLGREWYNVWENPEVYLFTYEYNDHFNKWELVGTQIGDYKCYLDNHEVLAPQDVCLVENSKHLSKWVEDYKTMQN